MREVKNLPPLHNCNQQMLDENSEEEYFTKVSSDAITREIVKITNSKEEVRCVMNLKRTLALKYSNTFTYQSNT